MEDSDISEDCDPIVTNADLGELGKTALDGITPLDPAAPAYPCGLVAKSVFTDTYRLYNQEPGVDPETGRIQIVSDNIAWESDKEYKFKNIESVPEAYEGKTWQ